MQEELLRYAFRFLIAGAAGLAFYLSWRARQRRKQMSIRPARRP